jgi:pyruvate-formate lyase-activating enzyme
MFNENTFCILPWSSIQINPSGDFKVCCFSGVADDSDSGNDHGMCLDDNGEVMNVMTHTIMDALNSNYHKEVRLAQSKNERHSMCKVCWDRDDANARKNQLTTSLRYFRSFRQLPDLDNAIPLEKAQSVMKDDGSIDQYPISLDLRFTNVCNMKCIMCSARYSNQWYEDEMALFNTNEIKLDSKTYQIRQENGVYKTDMPVWHDSDNWWEQFDTIKHRVRHLYLTGGEPFIVKGHDVLLDKLIESGDAKNIILEYDTNLTVINDKILNRLQHFKQIILSISCDDIEERFELIRFPGKFNVMLQNLKKLKDRNLQIRHLSSCVGIYSLYSPIKLYEYFKPMGYDTYSFRMLRAPRHNDVANLPDSLKLKMIDVYNNSTLPDRWKNFLCGYLENTLGKYTEDEGRMNVKKHIQFLNKMDELRGTDWKKTLPEIADLLKECL